MATSQQIITDLQGLGASKEVIGYFTALKTFGYIIPVPKEYVPLFDLTTGDQPQARAPRNRGISKTAQAITAVFVPEGMSKRDIVKKTGLTAKQVETALPTMAKNGYAYTRNSRWFAGPAPVKSAAGRPAGTTKTTPMSAKKTDISLSAATLKAVQATRQEGADAKGIIDYLSQEFGMTVRPNHLGIALTRHGNAGRLEHRGTKWYMPNVEELRQAS